MTSLDKLVSSTDIELTVELQRLFKYAGCSPTICHACEKEIQVGQMFKLVPHIKKLPENPEIERRIPTSQREGYMKSIDEMCCSNCGDKELTKRDNSDHKYYLKHRSGGYSRPSIKEDMR